MKFGEAFRQKRRESKQTLGDVARCLNRSISYLSDIELSQRKPLKPDEIVTACELFGCDPTSLLKLAAGERGSISIRSSDPTVVRAAIGLARGDLSQGKIERLRAILEEDDE